MPCLVIQGLLFHICLHMVANIVHILQDQVTCCYWKNHTQTHTKFYLLLLFWILQVNDQYTLRLRKKLQYEERKSANQRKVLKFKCTFVKFQSSCLLVWGWISFTCYFCLAGSFWFRISKVVKSCSWKNLANLHGADCIPTISFACHTVVLEQVQAVDCCMDFSFYCFLPSVSGSMCLSSSFKNVLAFIIQRSRLDFSLSK